MSDTNGNDQRPSSFRSAVFSTKYGDESRKMQFGENGCLEFSDTGSDLLNLSQLVRGNREDPREICHDILSSSSARDVSDLFILTFVTRNVRGGKGEKDLSYNMFLSLWKYYPETTKKLLPLFAGHYGYWKDLLLLTEKSKRDFADLTEPILTESVKIIRDKFQEDLDVLAKHEAEPGKREEPDLSLLAKWLPRENSHFDKTLGFVDRFLREDSFLVDGETNAKDWKSRSKATYRKQVAKLTSYLSLPEVLLSAQRADEINFHKVAARATLKLSKAFLNEDMEDENKARFANDRKRQRCAEKFLEHIATTGLKGGTLMPDEIVHEIMKEKITRRRELVLDSQWRNLWKDVVKQIEAKARDDGLEYDPSKMVPLCDVSGSMIGKPMEVSIALGIGVSEITHPAFRDMVLTFEDRPRWHKLNASDGIAKKVRSLEMADWGCSTNFELAYDEILKVCVENKLAKNDVPSLIVFSDMQFNQAARGTSRLATMHETIRSKFAATAKVLDWEDSEPTPIIYWNLRTRGHPVDQDTEGTVLLSGFSPSMLKMVMNGEALEDHEVEVVESNGTVRTEKVRVTPSQVLRKVLDDPLYDSVREILVASDEGVLKDFKVFDLRDSLRIVDESSNEDEFVML